MAITIEHANLIIALNELLEEWGKTAILFETKTLRQGMALGYGECIKDLKQVIKDNEKQIKQDGGK